MTLYRMILLGVICFSLLGGCSPREKSLVVLLHDPDGGVGAVSITNKGGSQVISDAGYGVYIQNMNTAPSEPILIDEAEIQKVFGEVLAIEPQLPKKYVLYFQKDTPDLTDDSLYLLPEILDTIKNRNSRDVSVIGHTDRVGTDEYNFRLSLERAIMVRDILISSGVDPAIIETTSHGEGNPLIETDDNVAEPANRRVEITIR